MAAPEWMDKITNETICTVMFGVFVLVGLYLGLLVLEILRGIFPRIFKAPFFSAGILIATFTVFTIGVFERLSHYLICVRALTPSTPQ